MNQASRPTQPRSQAASVPGVALMVLVTLAAGLSLGCETDSFFDPSVVGRWERTPVVLPILEQLDVIDEPPARAPGTTSVRQEDLQPVIREYVIGPGDLVTFTIFELIIPNVESIQTRRVNELGSIRLPVLGAVPAAGLSPSELEERIVRLLEEREVLRDATVSVVVQEGRQNTYSVIGEPGVSSTGIGTYTIPHADFRLLEAMALARGIPGQIKTIYVIRRPTQRWERHRAALFDQDAADASRGDASAAPSPSQAPDAPTAEDARTRDLIDRLLGGIEPDANPDADALEGGLQSDDANTPWIYVDGQWVRIDERGEVGRQPGGSANADDGPGLQPADDQPRIIEVPYSQLLAGDTRYDIVIRPGDVIRVPAPVIGNVYIGGAINRPGTYTLPGDKDLTLKQLIFAAGNLAQIAVPERVDLIRRVGDDREAIVRVDVRAIFNGSEPDFYLKPNDTINIGTSFLATPLAVIRNGFRTTYGFGFLLDRNFENAVFGARNASVR